jgi:4'-phosphopantetheinyl transferase EntD
MLGEQFAVATAVTALVNDQLFPQELTHIGHASAKRQAEFGTARVCARQALAKLGMPACPLVPKTDRSPSWPSGVKGSISHAADRCAVVVSSAPEILGVGLDFEPDLALNPDLERLICTSAELDWLANGDPASRGFLGKLVFCAKEAYYKCQYPSTGVVLDFTDVVLAIDLELGMFQVASVRGAMCPQQDCAPMRGLFARAHGLIIATAVMAYLV